MISKDNFKATLIASNEELGLFGCQMSFCGEQAEKWGLTGELAKWNGKKITDSFKWIELFRQLQWE